MLRTDVSFRSCLRETIAWTASTEQGSIFHTACITSFSNSASGGRTTARRLVGFVMVQVVPQPGTVAKRFLEEGTAEPGETTKAACRSRPPSILCRVGD